MPLSEKLSENRKRKRRGPQVRERKKGGREKRQTVEKMDSGGIATSRIGKSRKRSV